MDESNAYADMLSTSPANSSFVLPSVDGSPPKVVTMQEMKHVVENIQNMTLAHEIALNPDFKLQPYEPPFNSLERRIKDMVHKAFWDLLREQLNQNPPCYDHAIQLLSDIKECFPQILSLNNKRALNCITEVLDANIIKQQAELGVLDFKSYANFIIQIMAKSCAPVRDDAVKKLSEIHDVVDTFRGILETMTLMKLDMANYLLDHARNDILTHSVEYEKEKFKSYLEYYKFGFPATEYWLKHNRTYDANNQPSSNTETIYNAYMELIEWQPKNEFPEVLSLDKERILKFNATAQRICLAASLMSIVQAVPVVSNRPANRIELAHQIEILLVDVETQDEKSTADALTGIYEQIRSYINTALVKESFPAMSESTEENLKNQVLQLANKNSPVRTLLWKRLITVVSHKIRTYNADITKELPSYSDYMKQVIKLITAFKRVISYNHAVFGEYFLEILNKVVKNPEQRIIAKISENDDANPSGVSNTENADDLKHKQ